MKNFFTLILGSLFCHLSANSSPQLFSPTGSEYAKLRTNLYIIAPDGTNVLMDGTLTEYDTDYSNDVNGMDARKMFNPSENFGMPRGNTILIIERRRTIEDNDSIFFKMWNMRIVTYKLDIVSSNLNKPGRVGVIEDNFLKTATPIDLNDTSTVIFSVTNNPASYASDRFRIIFSTTTNQPVPFTFTSVSASEQNNGVSIDWKTANENNVKQYNIEKSSDDIHFIKSIDIKADNSSLNNYHWVDAYPAEGNNYYRISSVEIDGKTKYSDVMKVSVGKMNSSISIFPNPATGSTLNLQLLNQQPGIYEARLVNLFGQTFMAKSIRYTGGNSIENLKPGKSIPAGIYQLEVKTPGGQKKVLSVVF